MFEQAFKNIDDVLWKEAGCTTELDYTEQTSWLLFLKYLDGLEQDLADEAALACQGRNQMSEKRRNEMSAFRRSKRPVHRLAFDHLPPFLFGNLPPVRAPR